MSAGAPSSSPATSPAMTLALARLGASSGERKHSVVVAGHRTSVSVEPMFWDELRRVAQARRISLNELVGEIDRTRTGSLSSAIRVFALARVCRTTV